MSLRTWVQERLDSRRATRIIARVRAAQITYCGPPKLETLAAAALRVRRGGVPGIFLEAGVALGGSAIVLGRIKPPGVPLYLYDVYSMIPPPGDQDGADAHARYSEISAGRSKGLGGGAYYGYVDSLLDVVKANFRKFAIDPDKERIVFVKGLYQDTLAPDGPVALAHIDCDWYDSVRVCIDRIVPRLSPGGMLIFDDYSSYSGCRKAVDELLQGDRRFEIVTSDRSIALRLGHGEAGGRGTYTPG